MIFIDNKYTRWYYSIVTNAQSRVLPKETYTEKHHIIPKSLGGSNEKCNLVKLTAREHFICHWLLTKMTNDKRMIFALNRMLTSTNSQQRIKITGRKFELVRQIAYKSNPFNCAEWQESYGGVTRKGVAKSEMAKRNMKLNHADVSGPNNPMYGKIHSLETLRKISAALKGKLVGDKNGFYGKTHTNDVREMLSQNAKKQNGLVKNRIYVTCVYCKKELDLGNFTLYHGSKCKCIR